MSEQVERSDLQKWLDVWGLQMNIVIGQTILAIIFDWLEQIEKDENCGGYIP